MAVILEGSALMLECAGCGELYLEGDSPARRKEGALEAWREKHTACPVVPVQLAAAAPALEDDATDLVKQLAPDLTEVHARVIAARLLERYEIPKIPGRLEAATRMVAELGAQLVRSRRLEARPGLLEELERLRAALTSACCVGCKAVLPDVETAARHVEVCLKHPLGQARQRVASLEAILEDELRRLEGSVRAFEQASGVKLHAWNGGEVGKAVRFVQEGGVSYHERRLRGLVEAAETVAAAVREALAGLPGPPPAEGA